MGAAALSDARSILSIAISHNMDNVDPIDQANLAKYMGLTKDASGNTVTTGGTNPAVADASNSKKMEVATGGTTITYKYRRGGVCLKATIDVPSQTMTWEVSGIDGTTNANRKTALREGLKLASDTDLTVAATGTDLWT